MAVDPATLKAVAKIATTVVSDERGRRAVFIACLIPLVIILLVLSSPFAIFFALVEGQEEQIPVLNHLDDLRHDFEYRIKSEQDDSTADIIKTVIMGSEDGITIDNSEDVLIVYAILYNMTEDDAEQVAVLSKYQTEKLYQVFRDMNIINITYETTSKIVEVEIINDEGETVIEKKKIQTTTKTIEVDCLTAEEIGTIYGFNEKQTMMVGEMRRSGYGIFLATSDMKTALSREIIEEIKGHVPKNLVLEGERAAEVAKSIVGQVNYFWGGKSVAMVWDRRWGENKEVTSPGSSTTGTIRPFGLDCSGFVTWVFVNLGLPVETIEKTIGHGTTAQWNLSTSVPESTTMPGDLAFIAIPNTRKVNHIGIIVGKDEEGHILVAHCTSGANNVVITTADSAGFVYYRRPVVLLD